MYVNRYEFVPRRCIGLPMEERGGEGRLPRSGDFRLLARRHDGSQSKEAGSLRTLGTLTAEELSWAGRAVACSLAHERGADLYLRRVVLAIMCSLKKNISRSVLALNTRGVLQTREVGLSTENIV